MSSRRQHVFLHTTSGEGGCKSFKLLLRRFAPVSRVLLAPWLQLRKAAPRTCCLCLFGLADEAQGIPECGGITATDWTDGYKKSPNNLKSILVVPRVDLLSALCCCAAATFTFCCDRMRHLSTDPHSVGVVCVRCGMRCDTPRWATVSSDARLCVIPMKTIEDNSKRSGSTVPGTRYHTPRKTTTAAVSVVLMVHVPLII